MERILIENAGEIDARAFSLVGASTKVDDPTTIGEFGSGLNYSIAWLFRNNLNFKVFSGTTEIVFGLQHVEMRGKDFQAIQVNGETTSITTAMGKDWKGWYVIREFWCNALDEGKEFKERRSDEPDGVEGKTRIWIELNDELRDVFYNWQDYFASNREDLIQHYEYASTDALYDHQGVKIYSGGPDLVVYRKGVQVYFKKGVKSVFHYDFDNIQINESRVITSEYSLNEKIRYFLGNNADIEVIRLFANGWKGCYEVALNWNWQNNWSDAWAEFLEGAVVVGKDELEDFHEIAASQPSVVLPDIMSSKLTALPDIHHIGGKMGAAGIRVIESTPEQGEMITEAISLLSQLKYKVDLQIKFAVFKTSSTLGAYTDKTIFLAEGALKDMKTLCEVIIEENEHGVNGYHDNTREFQSQLISLALDMAVRNTTIDL